ncbi:serine/arginine-rich SC35-like splicing factor SCL30 [Zingiber officinale]|uniref:serine/arginine-rich SC35-like splicing factor SCL30 n=1 Tax=Zingiber officinale TaxID=94328 RepID=UPI001C4C7A48|nr:serine/arginine-rich SC35-like splicing factor SCL30 [Zingiber officinale]XP_042403766.1 serine/arginine-rich SC35-like splicing factor SCL30 [Zingiber officinale]XP_042403767.1 serine/arginine-rich SC35-like splicing factor SCL30 [Zingiber officinale]XP_042407299.1 serine/arginine-rich SC35-like splicing factor SCL30 [Zingiber officinale]XP_042407300.1 serine/arginine-rich SC35-like splicing factor SCL30 [Zingiber officinale]XP_042407301.1 serine/arginine-rich SC35-like splicing factor SCL
MRRYSPPYHSPPRRGYGGRGRSPPRRGYGGGYGGKEQGSGSLLVRNIPLNCRPEDLRAQFDRFGPVRDVYLPKNYYSGEPRGFAFIEFVDPYDASEAQYHMNRQVFGGREITVVVAAESRKRPDEMRKRGRVRGPSGYDRRRPSHHGRSRSRSRSRSHSPRYSSRARHHSRSYSPAPKSRHDDYSPNRRQRSQTRSPREHSRERSEDDDHRINSPSYKDANRNGDANGYDDKRLHDAEGSRHQRSPRPKRPSVSPPGSRSRSADSSPR